MQTGLLRFHQVCFFFRVPIFRGFPFSRVPIFKGSNTPAHLILKGGFQSLMAHCYVWTVHALAMVNICKCYIHRIFLLEISSVLLALVLQKPKQLDIQCQYMILGKNDTKVSRLDNTVLVLSSIENKNDLIESDTGLETPANFSATNRLDTRKTSNYPAWVET